MIVEILLKAKISLAFNMVRMTMLLDEADDLDRGGCCYGRSSTQK